MKKIILVLSLLTFVIVGCQNNPSDDTYSEDSTTSSVSTTVPEETTTGSTTVPEETTTGSTSVPEETTTGSNNDNSSNLSLEDIIAQTYAATDIEFPTFINQPLTKENQSYMLGVDNFDFIQGIVSEPMMSSIAHSFVLFTVEEGSDIQGIKESIKANVDGMKWICVGVDSENIIVDNIGNMIILIMDEHSKELHESLLNIMQ